MIIRTPPKLTNKKTFLEFIEVDLWAWMKEVYTGLFKITFKENFQCFIVKNLSIPANTEVAITNAFATSYPGYIPSAYIIVRQTGNAVIIDGDTKWTTNQVYLQNPTGNNTVVTVIFFM